MNRNTDLAINMINRANKDNLCKDHNLRKFAYEFDIAADGFFSEKQTVDIKKFMSAWAKARKCWSEYSGEPLI